MHFFFFFWSIVCEVSDYVVYINISITSQHKQNGSIKLRSQIIISMDNLVLIVKLMCVCMYHTFIYRLFIGMNPNSNNRRGFLHYKLRPTSNQSIN